MSAFDLVHRTGVGMGVALRGMMGFVPSEARWWWCVVTAVEEGMQVRCDRCGARDREGRGRGDVMGDE